MNKEQQLEKAIELRTQGMSWDNIRKEMNKKYSILTTWGSKPSTSYYWHMVVSRGGREDLKNVKVIKKKYKRTFKHKNTRSDASDTVSRSETLYTLIKTVRSSEFDKDTKLAMIELMVDYL